MWYKWKLSGSAQNIFLELSVLYSQANCKNRVGLEYFGKFKLKGQRKGRMNTTRRGFNCQNWQKNYPHEVKIKPINADHNYCRNPEGDPRGPWCYTTSEVKWDYCFIPQCECVHTCLPDKAGFNHIAYQKAFIV